MGNISLCGNRIGDNNVAVGILDLSLELEVLAALERKEGLDIQVGLLG